MAVLSGRRGGPCILAPVKVTSLGHAGLKVETAGGSLLIDPWLSPQGAFQASWFQFPDNSHLVRRDLFEPAALIISHEHRDHIDPWSLARIPPHVPVFIPRYPSPVLRRKVEEVGSREIVEVPPWRSVEPAPGVKLFFVSEESPMNHDSAIVVLSGGRSLLNLNDARLSPVQFRSIKNELGGVIDAFAFQGAGASWYPMCYEYPEERRRRLSRSKRAAKLAYTWRTMEIVEPVMGLPFAGPPCFLDPELFPHNDEMESGIFPDQQQVCEFLADRGIGNTAVLLPGDAWDLEARSKEPDPMWSDFSFADRQGYLRAYAERRRPHLDDVLASQPEPSGPLWDRFEDYFRRLLELSPYFNQRVGMRVGFDITGPGGGEWTVDFRPGSEGVSDRMGECGYTYRFESRWLLPILEGAVPWEDFFLSLRFSARRDPDVYNDHLLGLLKFADRNALAEVEAFETSRRADEWITVHAEGRAYRVERYCPHAGNDLLETGEVLPGRVLRCLAHHYEFDLESGRCLNGTYGPLDVTLVGSDGSAPA
jgi:UDP-MurNAc hydroxylase